MRSRYAAAILLQQGGVTLGEGWRTGDAARNAAAPRSGPTMATRRVERREDGGITATGTDNG